jgi:hypothetical protein
MEEKRKVSMGDRFSAEGESRDYLLAQVDYGMMALVGLRNGNRWNAPVLAKDVSDISIEEMKLITKDGEFTRKEKEV